ncbi:MAG: NAD(P)/FAD-dependent oxidoreductase [Chitinivibrionales bacterium]|nr:NAD(P)/FAD-dependent oxidoreductase [Chitinivibrionales bacterium]
MESNGVDVLIIGAGVVGLAVAAEVASPERSVVLVEKNPALGMETSSRNSEVIHAGIYYAAGALKARLCLEGKELLYRLCNQAGIAHKKIGKIIVSTDKNKSVEPLAKKAAENGVDDLTILSAQEIRRRFHGLVAGEEALYSPSTGIVDSHGLMKFLEKKALAHEAIVCFNSAVIAIEKHRCGYEVTIQNADGSRDRIAPSVVVNCAGLHSEEVATMAGFEVQRLGYTLTYRKGEYFKLQNRNRVPDSPLVYPLPGDRGLGTHTVIDMAGAVRIGPYAYFTEKKIDYTITDSNRRSAYDEIVTFLPQVVYEDLSPDMAGISPDRRGPFGQSDFIITEESGNGFPGFINCIGINSPGLTSSLSIARMVDTLIQRI